MKQAFSGNILPFENLNHERVDDYEKDGLLYCGSCHTAKQMILEIPSFPTQTVSVLCECQNESRHREQEVQKKRDDLLKIQRQKSHCIHDKALRNWTFENDDGSNAQLPKAKKYVEQWQKMKQDNIGLLLWGSVGSGKTYFASCIANALLEQQVSVMMTSFTKILNALNNMYNSDRNQYIQDLNRYSLLVIDDFGVERNSEYAIEQITSIIDTRSKSEKPLIVTTNLHLDQIREARIVEHQRIYSRVLAMCMPICFVGEDLRVAKAEQKMKKAKELFSD